MRIMLSPNSRKMLFNYLKEKNKVSTLKELALKMKIPFKTINHWHYDYKKFIPEKLIEDYKRDLEILDKKPDNWGQSKGGEKGGKVSVEKLRKEMGEEKYKKMMQERGRKAINTIWKRFGKEELTKLSIQGKMLKRKIISEKLEKENEAYFVDNKIELDTQGIIFSNKDKKKNIKLPKQMSPELAEEIGVHLGDGCLSYNKRYFSVKTNKKEDKYMIDFLLPLYKRLYNLDLKIMRLPSVVGFEIYSPGFFDFKNKTLGIPYGNKVEKIEVPHSILDSKNKEIYQAFIRGLFDTDGCVNIVKSKKNYPIITFTIKSQKLIKQTTKMLEKLGFIPYSGKYVISLNGKVMLEKWIKEISSNNPKNLARLQQASSSARIE